MRAEWDILLAQWLSGVRSREAALRLLFLSWYSCSEPQYLSGLEEVVPPEGLIDDLFEFLGGKEAQDTEVLYVVAVMAGVAAWCLGDEHRWERVAERFRARLGDRAPAPRVFADRGEYGVYFAHHARRLSGDAT